MRNLKILGVLFLLPLSFLAQEKSTYDNYEYKVLSDAHKKELRELNNAHVFDSTHTAIFKSLSSTHKDYFTYKTNYRLITYTEGAIFSKFTKDAAFTVYDTLNARITILFYSQVKDLYLSLYNEINVVNGLKATPCNYSNNYSIDFMIGDEIVSSKEFYLKHPKDFLERVYVQISDLKKNENIYVDKGCINKKVNKKYKTNAVCITTSFVYNNWECLKVNELNGVFTIFYGQAFAD